MSRKVAVVTGSNKGIGFAIVKGLLQQFDGVVYLTSRDEERGKAAVAELNELGLYPEYHQLDITNRQSIIEFKDHINKNHGGIDILINNAAVSGYLELDITHEELKHIVNVNYYSILTLKEILYPVLRDNARVLNMSSNCGHLSNIKNKHWIERLSRKDLTVDDVNEFVSWFLDGRKNGRFNFEDIADGGTVAAYRITKVALSAVTMIHQKEYKNKNICMNSMHPGLVRTDLTKGVGFYSVDDAAKIPLYMVLEASDTVKGAYVWYDGKILDWYDHTADYYFRSATLKKE